MLRESEFEGLCKGKEDSRDGKIDVTANGQMQHVSGEIQVIKLIHSF